MEEIKKMVKEHFGVTLVECDGLLISEESATIQDGIKIAEWLKHEGHTVSDLTDTEKAPEWDRVCLRVL